MAMDVGIDLGTANVLVYIKNKGIVLDEPSVVAVNNDTDEILAVGEEARQMLGRTPANIVAVKPLKDGVISDYDITERMLKYFIRKACGTGRFFRPRIMVCVPSGITEVEKRAVREATEQAGGKSAFLIEEPVAAAIGAGLDVDSSTACMIADIGGGTTDIAIVALGGVVASTSIRHAGDKFNDAIIQYVRKRHSLLIGEKTAEKLKIQAGAACLDTDENGDEIIKTVKASGRDIISGLPKIIDVTNRDIMLALQESVDIVIDGIKATIEKAPPEIAADIAESGIVLSGGGGLIYNLDKLIEKRTGMKASIAENAFEAVALGTGMSLNDIEKLKVYASSVKRR